MGKRFDLLVFDWDGTLIDSTGAIIDAIQSACRDLGLPEPTRTRASHFIGLGLSEILSQLAPGLSADRIPLMIERYRFHFLLRDHELRLFDGAFELIRELHASGFILAVATGKSRRGLDRAMAFTGLGAYFSATRCADECFSKPHPQMLQELMEDLSTPPHRTLMIGDTTHDLQLAENAGVAGLAVDYGAHPRVLLDAMNPLARVHDIYELGAWLRAHA